MEFNRASTEMSKLPQIPENRSGPQPRPADPGEVERPARGEPSAWKRPKKLQVDTLHVVVAELLLGMRGASKSPRSTARTPIRKHDD